MSTTDIANYWVYIYGISMIDYKNYTILYIDDEVNLLKSFYKLFSKTFSILTADNANDGIKIIENNHDKIGILITDQRMPGTTGVKLLEQVRNKYPHIIRILVTAYSDIESAVDSVNIGAIFKYICKPWNVEDLRITLMRAFDFFELQKERNLLLEEKVHSMELYHNISQKRNILILSAGLNVKYNNAVTAINNFFKFEKKYINFSQHSKNEIPWQNMEKIVNNECDNISQIISSLLDLDHRYYKTASLKDIISSLITTENHQLSIKLAINADLTITGFDQGLIRKLFIDIFTVIDTTKKESSNLDIFSEKVKHDGVEMLKISFVDDEPDWSNEQFSSFFPHPLMQSISKEGIALFTAYIVIHHLGGKIEVPGTKKSKIDIYFPNSTEKAARSDITFDKNILFKLYRGDKEI